MRILFTIYRLDYADHVSIGYLSAVAKNLGHQTWFCNLSTDDLEEQIAFIKPDLVAYSTNVFGFDALVAAHKAARARFEFTSIMGGPHVTFFPDTFKGSGADFYCLGEGEGGFHDFLVAMDSGKGYEEVGNLLGDGFRNPLRRTVDPLDQLPMPDRSITLETTFLRDTPKKTFYASRGCPFQCTYCCIDIYNEMYRGKGKTFRRFSPERILEEIEMVGRDYNMDFIKFGDDLFAIKADDWLEEFTTEYARRVGKPFNCYLRFDTVDKELVDMLKGAGCHSVHLSVDSSSDYIREEILGRRMRKGVDIPERLKMIRDGGIETWVNYMLAAPESTIDLDLETIEISRKGRVSYPAYSVTVPMEGTALFDRAVSHGLIDASAHRSDMTGCHEKSMLNSFTDTEKSLQLNIYLTGALISKLPPILAKIAIALIKVIPPNRFFRFIRQRFYQYSIENVIFDLHAEPKKSLFDPAALWNRYLPKAVRPLGRFQDDVGAGH